LKAIGQDWIAELQLGIVRWRRSAKLELGVPRLGIGFNTG
jgi:hypothetical protein